MWKNTILVLATLFFAFSVLLISVFRTASVKYEYNPLNPQEITTVLGEGASQVDYYLPYPGRVLPDSPLWSVKASRDKLWILVNTSETREAELKLLFADKRLGSAVLLFEKGNADLGLSTLTKAEKYLEEAYFLEIENRQAGRETADFLRRLALASLKHYETMEYLITFVPEEIRPEIIHTQNYPKNIFEGTRNALLDKGETPPDNPFNW